MKNIQVGDLNLNANQGLPPVTAKGTGSPHWV